MKNRKLKIAIITPDFYPKNIGGCGISAYLLTEELRQRDYTVDVFSLDKITSTTKTKKGVTRRYKAFPKFPILNNLVALYKLRGKVRNHDVIHTFNVDLIPACSLLKSNNSILIATLNNTKGAVPSTFKGTRKIQNVINDSLITSLIKLFKNQVDTYLALTKSVKKLYQENGYENKRIVVIPNMFDPKFATNYMRKTNCRLLYVGQLSEKKGINSFIQIFIKYISKFPESKLTLTVCGRGKLKPWIQNVILNTHKTTTISLIESSYEHLPQIYHQHDVLIHPAKWHEPFSRTWLEAMQSSLLIVSTKNPSALEVLPENTLFYTKEEELWKILALLDNEIFPQSNNQQVNLMYSPSTITDKIEKYYYD